MPIAYLVLCHHSPGDVADLVARLYRPGDVFVLHADAKAAPLLHAALAGLAARLPNVHVLPAQLCSWGGWSLVETTLRGIDFATRLPVGWQHLAVLSESHLPVRPPDEIEAALTLGVSYFEAVEFSAITGDGRPDMLHRLGARHQELPGVGMFPVAARRLSPSVASVLHHGSQWVVLARDACLRLADSRGDAEGWAPFRTALLADETAIHSVLLGTRLGMGLTLERRHTTFVAWPHLADNSDMAFTAANFHAARAEGYLFIRKRPRDLPDEVASLLPPPRFTIALPAAPAAPPANPAVGALASAIAAALKPSHPDTEIAALLPLTPGGSAACYLRLRTPALAASLSVCVLSEDMQSFKALLVWTPPGPPSFALRTLGGYPACALRVRLTGLFDAREIVLPSLPGGGFATHEQGGLPQRLAGLAGLLLDAGAKLDPPAA